MLKGRKGKVDGGATTKRAARWADRRGADEDDKKCVEGTWAAREMGDERSPHDREVIVEKRPSYQGVLEEGCRVKRVAQKD